MTTKKVRYTVPLNEIESGTLELSYKIGKEFIEQNNIEGVLDCTINLEVVLKKHEFIHNIEYTLKGTVTVACDRCLDNLKVKISNKVLLVVKVSENGEEFTDADEVIIIQATDQHVDFTHSVYESILLSLPIQNVHAKGKCNEHMLTILNSSQAQQKNVSETNSPWDKLKNIFDN